MSLFNTHRVIVIIVLLTPMLGAHKAHATSLRCINLFDKYQEEKTGAQFLMDRNANFHSMPFVKRAVDKNSRRTKVQIQKPVEKVVEWLVQLSAIHKKASFSPLAARKLKEIFYQQAIIKTDDVPDSYFDLQVRIARERGLGDIRLTKKIKAELIESLMKDQKASLDTWIDYFLSSDTTIYPPWVKFWILSGVTKLSKFNPENGAFGNRDKNTVAPFVELNREALAYVVDSVLLKTNKQSLADIQDPTMIQLLDGANFGKLYGHSLLRAGVGRSGKFTTNVGQWVVYKQGSDPQNLVSSLRGKNTGWCTAGMATARSQLDAGDFHVYYSLDEHGMPVLPRIAIRMQGDYISEIRGVDKEQNLDNQMTSSDILNVKLNEFGARGEAYLKKERDMRQLTAIESKQNIGKALSLEELKFLYEVEHQIEGFGYDRDPRIKKILSKRNAPQDLGLIFGVSPEIISVKQNSKRAKTSRFHFGDWVIYDQKTANFYSIERIQGDVIAEMDVMENISFPASISGHFEIGTDSNFGGTTPLIIRNVILPNVPTLSFRRLQTIENVTFPSSMNKLTLMGPRGGDSHYLKPVNVLLPKKIDHLTLSVDSAEGLTLPELGSIFFYRLNTYKGMRIPENFTGEISLPIKDLENLVIPENFQGTLSFQRGSDEIPNLEGLHIPKNFKGRIRTHLYIDPMPGDFENGG